MKIKLKGINVVRKMLASGKVKEYHYLGKGKGAPCFWSSGGTIKKGTVGYVNAFKNAGAPQATPQNTFSSVLEVYLSSTEFQKLSPRTKEGILHWVQRPNFGILSVFGKMPLRKVEAPEFRGTALQWRDSLNGDRARDTAIRILQQIVSFGRDRGLLRHHQLQGIKATYRSNRADVIWTAEEVLAFCRGAPPYVANILLMALETGLRPNDLYRLRLEDFGPDATNSTVTVATSKGKRFNRTATIPVTDTVRNIVRSQPAQQIFVLVTSEGKPFVKSQSLGQTVHKWRDNLGLRKELHLYDARGTRATEYLAAGANMAEMATVMGWSIGRASEVIERYAQTKPEMAVTLANKMRGAPQLSTKSE